ncbi:MAG: hypothetical protein ACRC8Y_00045 [Chroococcales cyanobacterium]
MTIERITQGICEATGDRFLLLYGANTSDSLSWEFAPGRRDWSNLV